MKIGIVSDTHSNQHALKAVLTHMKEIGVDKKVHCGDVIGYGPRPSETLSMTLEEFNYIVMGNHDLAVIDEEASWGFNPQAKVAVDWTRDKLAKDDLDILQNLKYKFLVDDMLFVHGSPEAGNPHAYIIDHPDAKMAFAHPATAFKTAFIGHTHVPFLWTDAGYVKPKFGGWNDEVSEFTLALDESVSSIINVGSVGQPRDGDPRACYAIYDTELHSVSWYRIPYEIDRTVGLMQRAGFSNNACERLLFGR